MTLEYREIRSSITCFEMASFVNVMSPKMEITNDVFNILTLLLAVFILEDGLSVWTNLGVNICSSSGYASLL